jgi:hypothetical protein
MINSTWRWSYRLPNSTDDVTGSAPGPGGADVADHVQGGSVAGSSGGSATATVLLPGLGGTICEQIWLTQIEARPFTGNVGSSYTASIPSAFTDPLGNEWEVGDVVSQSVGFDAQPNKGMIARVSFALKLVHKGTH